MRILICDDDLELSQQLEKILISFFQKSSLKYPEIVIYNNGTDLLQDFQSKDIVFLDIEMPGMNGIYIGNELKQQCYYFCCNFLFAISRRGNALSCISLFIKTVR